MVATEMVHIVEYALGVILVSIDTFKSTVTCLEVQSFLT